MNKQIKEQRGQITDKETQIQTKNQQLKATEDEYDQKLKALQKVYEDEQKKKNEFELEFKNLKQELEDIDVAFPKEITDFKNQIV